MLSPERSAFMAKVGARLWNTGYTSAAGAKRWCRAMGLTRGEARALLAARDAAEIARPMTPAIARIHVRTVKAAPEFA